MLKNCHEANSISRITQIPRKDKQQKKGDVMTSKKFLPGERMNRPFSPGLWILIASLIIVLSPLNVIAKDNTPLGVNITMANAPDSSTEDLTDALSEAITLGSHGGFIWHWARQASLPFRLTQQWLIQQVGLKSFVQLSIQSFGLPQPPGGLAPTFADPETRAKYLENVEMFASLQPDYMNLSTEANFMYFWAKEEWDNYKTLYREAYQLIKEISPETKVGVSYHYSLFMWQQQFDLPADLGPYDYIAFTSYPAWLVNDGHYASIDEIPSSWYGAVRTVFPDAPILFSEIGWSSNGTGSLEDQAKFVEALPRLMSDVQPELITWIFLHETDYFQPELLDLLSEQEQQIIAELGIDMALLFVRFNGMGLRHLDGTPKPAWFSAIGLDFGY